MCGKRALTLDTQGGLRAYSLLAPAGDLLAVSGSVSYIQIYDVPNKALLPTLEGHSHWVLWLGFSPDGSRLASTGTDQTVRLWDPRENRELARFFGHQPTSPAYFSADGKRLVTALSDYSLRLYELDRLETPAHALIEAARKDYGVTLDGLTVTGDPDLYETRFESTAEED